MIRIGSKRGCQALTKAFVSWSQVTVMQANCALRVLEALAPIEKVYVTDKFTTVVVRHLSRHMPCCEPCTAGHPLFDCQFDDASYGLALGLGPRVGRDDSLKSKRVGLADLKLVCLCSCAC